MVNAVTVAEFARRQGVSRQRVYQWIAETPGFRPEKLANVNVLRPADQRRLLGRPRKRLGRPPGAKNKGKKIPVDNVSE